MVFPTRALFLRSPYDLCCPPALEGVGFELLALGIPTANLDSHDPSEAIAHYADEARRIPQRDLVLIAAGKDAQWLMQNIYEFLQPRSPTAIVFVDVTPDVELLSRCPCPYLLIHPAGENKDVRVLNAVKHHVYRYGDPTRHWSENSAHLGRRIAEWIAWAVRYRHEQRHWREMSSAS